VSQTSHLEPGSPNLEPGAAILETTHPNLKPRTSSLLPALLRLSSNPIARRELRGLVHQFKDWRLWVGVRLPKDARGWGVPAVAWFCLLPYIIWAALSNLDRVVPARAPVSGPSLAPMLDVMAICLVLLSVYLWGLAIALMAPSVTREREKETWESLKVTAATPEDIVLGLLGGRLLPVLGAYLLVGIVWVALLPHYAPLLEPYSPFQMGASHLAGYVLLSALMALCIGIVSMAASAWCKTSGRAVLMATTLGIVLCGAVGWTLLWAPWITGSLQAPVVLLGLTCLAYAAAIRVLKLER